SLWGSSGGRRGSYTLQATGQYGDKVKGGGSLAVWRQSLSPTWRVGLDQRFDYRDDRSFGRLTREWLAGLNGQVAGGLLSSGSEIELANTGAFENVLSDTTGFLLTNFYYPASLSLQGGDPFRPPLGIPTPPAARAFP